jgi:hypothetical protein
MCQNIPNPVDDVKGAAEKKLPPKMRRTGISPGVGFHLSRTESCAVRELALKSYCREQGLFLTIRGMIATLKTETKHTRHLP